MSGAVLLPGQVDGEPLASGGGKYVEISQVWFDGTAVFYLHHLHGEQAAEGDVDVDVLGVLQGLQHTLLL